jgi:hypothetical protein
MAVEKVDLNSGDDRSRVAYEMAKQLWWEEKQGHPKMTDEDFLELVHKCWKCFGGAGPGKPSVQIRAL